MFDDDAYFDKEFEEDDRWLHEDDARSLPKREGFTVAEGDTVGIQVNISDVNRLRRLYNAWDGHTVEDVILRCVEEADERVRKGPPYDTIQLELDQPTSKWRVVD